jgi:hypothetical protein
MGRCAFLADLGRCAEGMHCPVACEACRICEGHPMLASYLRLFAKRTKPLSYDATATAPRDRPVVALPPPAAAPPPTTTGHARSIFPPNLFLSTLKSELWAERQRRVQAENSARLQREHFARLRDALRLPLLRLREESSRLLRLLDDEESSATTGAKLNAWRNGGRAPAVEASGANQTRGGPTEARRTRRTLRSSPRLLYVHGAAVAAVNGAYTRLAGLRNGYTSYVSARGCELKVIAKSDFLGWGLTCSADGKYLYMTPGCMEHLPMTCTWFALAEAARATNPTSTDAGLPMISTNASAPLRGREGEEPGSSILQHWLPLWAMRANAVGGQRAHARSCAVVGSSGKLLYDRLGSEIDSHDVVVRFNDAPTAGYEPVVGAKSTVRVLNTKAAFAVLRRCTSPGTCEAKARSCCPQDPVVLLNSGRQTVADCFQRACGPAANIYKTLEGHPLVTSLRGASNGTGRIMSGTFGVAAALLLCRKKVNLYGFSSPGSESFPAGTSTNITRGAPPYHYYVRAPRSIRTLVAIPRDDTIYPPCTFILCTAQRES